MARNEEKQYGRLNRLYLLKEKEEYEKKNPKRPRLDTLDTVEEVQKWLPSIKRDIDFNLKKSQVTCYSDAHVNECREKVIQLEKEFKAFVWKIKQISPVPIEATPWTNRPYKRKRSEIIDEDSKKQFQPIVTPILDGKIDVCEIASQNRTVHLPQMDEPLNFTSKSENNELNVSSRRIEMCSSLTLCSRFKYSCTTDSLSRTSEIERNENFVSDNKKTNVMKNNVKIVSYESSDSETSEAL